MHKKIFQRLQTKCGALRHSWQHVVHGSKKSAREEALVKKAHFLALTIFLFVHNNTVIAFVIHKLH